MRFQWLAALLSLSVLAAATPAPLPGSGKANCHHGILFYAHYPAEDIVVRDPAIWYNADLGVRSLLYLSVVLTDANLEILRLRHSRGYQNIHRAFTQRVCRLPSFLHFQSHRMHEYQLIRMWCHLEQNDQNRYQPRPIRSSHHHQLRLHPIR